MLIFPNDIKLESIEDQDKAISLLHETNKVIKNRLTLLFFLFVIAVSFTYYLSDQSDRAFEYYRYISRLEKWRDTSDLQKYYEKHEYDLNDLYFVTDIDKIEYELKQSEYKDRMPIVNAISELKKERSRYFGKLSDQRIGLSGFSLPLTPIVSIGTLLLLLVYHDYAQRSLYRLRLIYALEHADVPEWKINSYGIPKDTLKFKSYSTVFTNSLSRIIISIINVVVIITGILFISLVSQVYRYYTSDLLATISAIFLAILFVEVVIVCFQNNYCDVQTLSITVHSLMTSKNVKTKVFARLIWPVLIIIWNVVAAVVNNYFRIEIIAFVIAIIPTTAMLPIGYYLKDKYGSNFLCNMIFFVGVVMSVFWLLFVPLVLMMYENVHRQLIEEFGALSVIVFMVAAGLSLFFARTVQVAEKPIIQTPMKNTLEKEMD